MKTYIVHMWVALTNVQRFTSIFFRLQNMKSWHPGESSSIMIHSIVYLLKKKVPYNREVLEILFCVCTGILKGRWRCLKLERGLHYKPEKAAKIVNCCAALHNVCVKMDNMEYLNFAVQEEEVAPILPPLPPQGNLFVVGNENRFFVIQHL